ncbi:alpha/beta hydrolase [Aquisalinus flavus]|uniref:Hydrolase n=1 Tax=Aquisalinus flavus TaxID=1526572 RepID=A0A8J2V5B8_9PROT|nr:alpha/beta hydrolase [Aquisalinus flavus]MBD0426627.1 alpha/beta hydrolase [Aquisalinus flavus]UNE47829.1 alpha/beta hydrolase [Aquisalinus flavus]GGD06357.1 hydrolase [Aquisalinus flavus]
MKKFAIRLIVTIFSLAVGGLASAGPMLEDFDYPWEVKRHALVSQQQVMEMAYMDVAPEDANGKAVVLLHGKNFCSATWGATMQILLDEGYRVIAPDQIGFCKSSKPAGYQYGLHTLAANTHDLLASIGADDPIIMGHSMGGMLAMRYAVQYGEAVSGLVLVNPIGLEDWRAKGVPAVTVDALYEGQLQTTRDSIKTYQRDTYYAGEWRPAYDEWVDMLWSMYQGEGGRIVAWHQALTADMVFNQPVVHEFDRITAPTLILIGEQDTTAIGKGRVSDDLRANLGNYGDLAQETAAAISNARLVTFPELGHSPHIQAPEQFYDALLTGLSAF